MKLLRCALFFGMCLLAAGCSGNQTMGLQAQVGDPAATDGALHSVLSTTISSEVYTRYIVVLQSGVTAAQRDALAAGLQRTPNIKYNTVFKGFAGLMTAREIAALRANPQVRILEKDQYCYVADANQYDELMREAYPWVPMGLQPQPDSATVTKSVSAGSQTTDWGVQRIGADQNTGPRGAGVTVAVIDTGCDMTHPDLAGAFIYVGGKPVSYNVIYPSRAADDGNGHGTHCAGIVGARDNTFGTVGVAPACNIVPVKVLSDRGSGSYSDVIGGVDWVATNEATYNIRVASMSLGGGFSGALNAAIDADTALGMTYCVAAGNSYADSAGFSPASASTVICVSALQNGTTNPATDYFATYSNYGTIVEVIAPGTNVFSTFRGARYATLSGTSMATPHVAGACALWFDDHWTGFAANNRNDALNALVSNGIAGPAGGWPTVPGQGRPDPDGVGEPLISGQNL